MNAPRCLLLAGAAAKARASRDALGAALLAKSYAHQNLLAAGFTQVLVRKVQKPAAAAWHSQPAHASGSLARQNTMPKSCRRWPQSCRCRYLPPRVVCRRRRHAVHFSEASTSRVVHSSSCAWPLASARQRCEAENREILLQERRCEATSPAAASHTHYAFSLLNAPGAKAIRWKLW